MSFFLYQRMLFLMDPLCKNERKLLKSDRFRIIMGKNKISSGQGEIPDRR